MKEVLDNGLTYEKIVTAATENYEEYYYKSEIIRTVIYFLINLLCMSVIVLKA